MAVKLGDKVKDAVTGYSGIVVAITEWLNGCRRISIQAPGNEKGKRPRDTYWVDEQQVKILKAGAVRAGPGVVAGRATKKSKGRTGGSREPSPRQPDPQP